MYSNLRGGQAFDDEDVARAYAFRPPYPEALIEFLVELSRHHRRALDLGCGTGKIAHALAPSFRQIDAVDPSAAMLRVAAGGRHANINWIHGFAESAALTGPYDLITAGASIHWMDHPVVFRKLASVLNSAGVVAVIEGDQAHEVPWQDDWERFLARWLGRLGRDYNPAGFRDWMTAFRRWMEIGGTRLFEGRYTQAVEHFIECQHSRATWSRANLGDELVAEFDAELRDLLLPYADGGMISFTTRSEVVWGRPLAASAAASRQNPQT
ncbi:class I SAM-dependent methyltransferase [soil metagenome]